MLDVSSNQVYSIPEYSFLRRRAVMTHDIRADVNKCCACEKRNDFANYFFAAATTGASPGIGRLLYSA
jgi:hypothetical protein